MVKGETGQELGRATEQAGSKSQEKEVGRPGKRQVRQCGRSEKEGGTGKDLRGVTPRGKKDQGGVYWKCQQS